MAAMACVFPVPDGPKMRRLPPLSMKRGAIGHIPLGPTTVASVTMLALVLMVGIVIDDAIVVLENIFRFVEEKKMTPMQAAKGATGEIALAVEEENQISSCAGVAGTP